MQKDFSRKFQGISWGQYTSNPTSHTVFQNSFIDLYNVTCQLYLNFKKSEKSNFIEV